MVIGLRRVALKINRRSFTVPRNAADCSTPDWIMGKDGKNSLRRTATLTKEQVTELERIAHRDGVSVSWLLRKGVEQLIERANDGPLLPGLVGDQHDQG